MARCVRPYVAAAVGLATLSGCGFHERPERPAWRTQAEEACLAEGLVKPSDFVQPTAAIDGPGICGLTHPFRVSALAGGSVVLNAPLVLDCSMIPALDRWVGEVVQPAAQANFGQAVVEIRAFGSYSCRKANNDPFARYSEHAFANAIDLAAFRLADGREVSVLKGWRGEPAERAFLRTIHSGACGVFTTVLGPGYPLHDNHFHLDLAMHGNTSRGFRRYCEPAPQSLPPAGPRRDSLPEPPPLPEDLDIAQAGSGEIGGALGGGPNPAAPPVLPAYQGSAARVPMPIRGRAGPTSLVPDGSPVDRDATSSIGGD